MSWGPDQLPAGPGPNPSAPSAPAPRGVRAAGVVVYVYAGLLLLAAAGLLLGAASAWREYTSPCPPDEGTCESFGAVVAFLLAGLAVVAVVLAGLGALLAIFLRRESRVAVGLTAGLGGLAVVSLVFTALTALAGDQPASALLTLALAAVVALPVGLVAPALLSRPPTPRR